MRLPFRRRSESSSSPNQQARPPPGPRPIRKSGNIQRSTTSTAYLSSSPHLSSSFEFNDARQRWSELARDRRSGLSLSLASASEELDAAVSIDSINISDPPSQYHASVRHVCTPPPFVEYHSTGELLAPSAATTESVASNSSGIPSANPSPTSFPHHPPRNSTTSTSNNNNNSNIVTTSTNSNSTSTNVNPARQLQFHSSSFQPQPPTQQQQPQQPSQQQNDNMNNENNTNNSNSTPTTSPNLGRQSFAEFSSPNPSSSLGLRVDYAELTALKQKFNQLDAEGKGFLSRSQFYELFSSLMDSSQPDAHQTPMFNFAYSLFQSAGDQLNLREFVTGMSILSKGSEEERLRYLFMMYDKDNSGNLNAIELKQVFRVMGSYAASHDFRASDSLDSQSLSALRTINPSVLDDLVEKTVRQYDLDGDGIIGFDDFVKWCQSNPVVKTWMDMLCYDTARGIARLRGESEKVLIARELEGLGIGANDFWNASFNLQNDQLSNPQSAPPPNSHGGNASNASASTGILPPAIPSASQPNVSMGLPDRSDSSGEYGADGGMRRRRNTLSSGSGGERDRGHLNNGRSSNMNLGTPPGESVDGMSAEMNESDRPPVSTGSMTQDQAIGSFEISFKELVFEKQIGSGSFALVWRCKWLDSPVAVKVFKSGPRLILNADGTPVVHETVSQMSSSSSEVSRQSNMRGGGNTNMSNNINNQHDGFVENGESFEPEFDSMMSARNAGVDQSLLNDEDANNELTKSQGRFLQEVSLLKSIRHPNLLLYMGACVDASYPLCIVSELIDGGSLFELLHGVHEEESRVNLSIKQKLGLTQDIARGMLYLHGRDPIVLHRDLKSANILVEPQNDDSYKGTIIDFGLSKFSSNQASIAPGRGRGLTGSLVTMAPEVMNGQKYEPRSDVYSYAIVCWEIWCGRIPFGRITAPAQLLMKVAIQGGRPEFEASDNVPSTIQKLIKACWDQDIRKRPDFLMIVKTLNDIRHELAIDRS